MSAKLFGFNWIVRERFVVFVIRDEHLIVLGDRHLGIVEQHEQLGLQLFDRRITRSRLLFSVARHAVARCDDRFSDRSPRHRQHRGCHPNDRRWKFKLDVQELVDHFSKESAKLQAHLPSSIIVIDRS